MELTAGSDRHARQLFETSLKRPTDNSLAQAAWASSRLSQLDVNLENVDIAFTSEARAIESTIDGNWQAALTFSRDWLDDQPFDVRPAIQGSFIASVCLESWEESIAITRAGLRPNPRHPLLMNNLAYALICNGEHEEAARILATVDRATTSPEDQNNLSATEGLLAFRRNDMERGRRLYKGAIKGAQRAKNLRQEMMAHANLVQESVRHGLRGEWLTSLVTHMRMLRDDFNDKGDPFNKASLLCVSRAESAWIQMQTESEHGPIERAVG